MNALVEENLGLARYWSQKNVRRQGTNPMFDWDDVYQEAFVKLKKKLGGII